MGMNTGFIATLLFVSLIMIAMTSFIFSGTQTYGVQVPAQYQNSFNEFNATNALVMEAQGTSDNSSINPLGFGIGVDKSALIAGKQMQASAGLFNNLLNDMATIFRINPVLITILISIIAFFSIAAIIALIARVMP